jgi:hypothetical protein
VVYSATLYEELSKLSDAELKRREP